MKLPDARETLFSLKCYLGAIMALYLSYSIGLPRPFWAMTTAYIVSQPWSGAVRSKALYRLIGTFFGSAATVYLVPRLSNSPVVMTAAMVLWVGACLYMAVLDRTPRSYLFMLAGYTAAMIGFPSVTAPVQVFDTALARVEEITLGIVCATLVHSIVLPRGLATTLTLLLDKAVRDARNWMHDTLSGQTTEQKDRDRRVLANDITQLRLLSTHVPFDTGNLRWTSRAIRAMQDQIAALTPTVSAVEDRIRALQADGQPLPQEVSALLGAISEWINAGAKATHETAVRLRTAAARLTPAIDSRSTWRDALLASLMTRLRELIDTYDECLALRREIRAGLEGAPLRRSLRTKRIPKTALHHDRGLALLSALAAGVAISVCCAFWIGTAWSNGATAALMAAIFSCFFAAQDNPVPGIMQFLTYTIYSIPLSALYLLGIMPAIHSFEMLALAMLPTAFVLGIFIARPASTGKAMAMLFGFLGTMALQDTHAADLVSFIDGQVAQCIGVGTAAIVAAIFRTVSADWSARRIQAANWKELESLASASRAPSRHTYTARMLDRIGLLQPRLALAKRPDDLVAADALKDLRVGRDITELQRARRHLPMADTTIKPVLDSLARFFRSRSAWQAGETVGKSPEFLAQIDRAMSSVAATPQGSASRDRAVVALVGIRRAFFPGAPDYQPSHPTLGPVNAKGQAS